MYYIQSEYMSTPDQIKLEVVKKCYLHTGRNPNSSVEEITYFEDLLTSAKQPEYDQGIFLVETKCPESGKADVKARYTSILFSWNR